MGISRFLSDGCKGNRFTSSFGFTSRSPCRTLFTGFGVLLCERAKSGWGCVDAWSAAAAARVDASTSMVAARRTDARMASGATRRRPDGVTASGNPRVRAGGVQICPGTQGLQLASDQRERNSATLSVQGSACTKLAAPVRLVWGIRSCWMRTLWKIELAACKTLGRKTRLMPL